MRETARRLLDLLRRVEVTQAYGDEELLQEIKTLNLRLAPAYARLYGATPLITTSYPPRVWLTRAKEAASDALAFLEANPALEPSSSVGEGRTGAFEAAKSGETPFAFLLMPFDEHFAWLREEIVAAGHDVGVRVTRADDIFAAGSFLEQIKNSIREADAIVAVCTGRNPNVFYELGISEPLHDPILVAEDAKDLPSDIAHLRAQLYGGSAPPNTRDTLRARIGQALKETLAARRVAAQPPTGGESDAQPRLNARVERAGNDYSLVVENEGAAPIQEVHWESGDDASNWSILIDVLPSYPLPLLEPGDAIRVPVATTMGGPASIEMTLRGRLQNGTPYQRCRTISIWG